MMKTDSRILATRKALREALLEILKTEKMGAITVKKVCETADISRATFYKHYKDCYDLLAHIEEEMVSDFQEALVMLFEKDAWTMVEALYNMLEGHRDLCMTLLQSGEKIPLFQHMIEQAWEVCKGEMYERFPAMPHNQAQALFDCLAHGFMHLVVYGGKTCSHEEIAQMVEKICKVSMEVFK